MYTQGRKFGVRYRSLTMLAAAAVAIAISLTGISVSSSASTVRAANASQQCITCWGS